MAKWEQKIKTNDIADYSDIENLKGGGYAPYPSYALELSRYAKLDGNYNNVDSIDVGHVGYVSKSISDENGDFITYPTITIEYVRDKTAGGVDFIFNERSNDYPSLIEINWYKNDVLKATKEYEVDSPRFVAEKEIDSFTKVEILFKKTNKPFRPIFVAFCDNYKITQTDGLKIIYFDTAYQGKENITDISGDATSYSEYLTLLSELPINHPSFAQCLPRYAKLDGVFENAPDVMLEMGFMSNVISKEDRTFETNPKITFTIGEEVNSLGFSIYGNNISGDYASKVKITYYQNEEVLFEGIYEPNSVDYFCEQQVNNYNKVVVEFMETSKPYRNAYMRGFDFGVVRVFTDKEITKCNCFEEINPISTELSINTLNFEILNINGLHFDFQKSQKCKLYFNTQILGDFYLKKGERVSDKGFQFKTEDFISILDENNHVGGIYENISASDLIREIFANEDVELIIDETFDSVLVSGYLPYDTKRNNLAQVCLAIGGIVDTSFDDSVYIYPFTSGTPKPIAKNEMYANTLKIDYGDVVSGVNLSVHKYIKGTTTQQLFKDTLTGQATITFNEPMSDLSISGGTIIKSGVNYAIVNGTGAELTLTGTPYVHTTQVITMENADIRRDKKLIDIEDATLITESNAPEVLSRLYDYYINNQDIKVDMLLEQRMLTDIVKLETYDGEKIGMLTSLDMEFSNEIKVGANIKCQYES